MQSIVVFCGSSEGYQDIYREVAYDTGAILAERGIRLVYGGARVGLMGAVADGALNNGGTVIGVIPSFLKTKEVAHEHLSQLLEVDTMHERKMKMHELSNGIMALPGSWGTMEELFEMLTWAQLGLHRKPIGILNVNNYYDPLLAMINLMVDDGFLKEMFRGMILVSQDPVELLEMMQSHEPINVPKWINKEET